MLYSKFELLGTLAKFLLNGLIHQFYKYIIDINSSFKLDIKTFYFDYYTYIENIATKII